MKLPVTKWTMIRKSIRTWTLDVQRFVYLTLNERSCTYTQSPAAIARLRGWGHLCRKPNPEALQDELGDLIAEALSEFWERHKPSS